MKTLLSFTCLALTAIIVPAFAEEPSNKQGIKTGAETVVNGAALIGITGAMTGSKPSNSYEGRKGGAKTWRELGDMHRAARPSVADFGK